MRETGRQLYEVWKIMWRLGGPFGILIYRLEGTLDQKIKEARR